MKNVKYESDAGTITALDFYHGGKAEVSISYSELVDILYETLKSSSKNAILISKALEMSDLLNDDFTQVQFMAVLGQKRVELNPIPDNL